MKYVRQSDNLIFDTMEIRRLHPNITIPEGADISFLGYEKLIPSEKPTPLLWHKVEESVPINNVQSWIQVPLVDNEIEAIFIQALENHYDSVAQQKRYDNRITCALRAGYPGVFQSEGIKFAIWMDKCNDYAYQQMYLVKSGQRPIPTTEQLISELELMSWDN